MRERKSGSRSLAIQLMSVSFLMILLKVSCTEKSENLAPYDTVRLMSDIILEEESFQPKITWIGGYAAVLGVNAGTTAALDSSLIWLIYAPHNSLGYPVQFGELPDGASDLTSGYSEANLQSLIEDSSYTFWVMKQEAWDQIPDKYNKMLFVDSSITGSSVVIKNDSIFASPQIYTSLFKHLDVYINIENIKPVGRLALIDVEQPLTNNNPKLSWTIRQSGVTDTLISAIGIVEGQSYNLNKLRWEVWSVDTVDGSPKYGTKNVIAQPVVTGQDFDGTHLFVKYPVNGLQRDRDYYIWIANKDWDGESRLRVTNFYAYVTFHTY